MSTSNAAPWRRSVPGGVSGSRSDVAVMNGFRAADMDTSHYCGLCDVAEYGNELRHKESKAGLARAAAGVVSNQLACVPPWGRTARPCNCNLAGDSLCSYNDIAISLYFKKELLP